MKAIDDNGGLICAFVTRPAGPVEPVAWQDMNAALAAGDAVVWLHFNLVDARARRWLETCERIPAPARAILLGSDNHVRLEPSGQGLVGVIGDLHHDFDDAPANVGVLRLYLDEHCLISARRQPLEAVDRLRLSMRDGLSVGHPVSLVTHFLQHLAETLRGLIGEMADRVDEVEDAVLAGKLGDNSGELGRIRPLVARLRRHMVPQRVALAGLMKHLPAWVPDSEANDLRQASERLDALTHDLDLVQERARLLQDEIGSRIAHATSRNLYFLSIVTTIFLPLTLISGIFGMNLGGLPGLQSPAGFWWAIGLMAVVAAGSVVILRRRGLM